MVVADLLHDLASKDNVRVLLLDVVAVQPILVEASSSYSRSFSVRKKVAVSMQRYFLSTRVVY
jgi:hypothetical protein